MHRNSKALLLKKIWLDHQNWFVPILLSCLAAVLFTLYLSAPTFKDPDSFYHLKIAELMMDSKSAIVDFPWLPFTTLGDAYVDHHFLYHVFLIPFILILPPITGMKVATVLLATGTIALFTILLQSHRVRYAPFFVLTLLFSQPFAFRMGLSKAPSFAFLFLVGGFWLITTRRFRMLALVSFFFVWSYGGFILLPILGTTYSIIDIIRHRFINRSWPNLRQTLTASKPLLTTYLGTIAGLLIHPSFPQHLQFYWQQVIQIGLINYGGQIGVGGEWYPLAFSDLIAGIILPSALCLIAIVAILATLKKQSVAGLTALCMTLVFFLFTLKSQRYIEYYVPWAVLFSALALQASGWLDWIPALIKRANHRWFTDAFTTTIGALTLFYLIFIIPSIWIMNAQSTYSGLHGGIPVDNFSGAGTWLRAHATKGDIIFHSDWDTFPQMFYQAARGRYIAGLDPTFLYNKSPDLYSAWVGITTGKTSDNLLETIQGDFHARFVIIENDHESMLRNITNDGRFTWVYEDNDYTIFRVPRLPAITPEATTEPVNQ
ncbi:MAG: hypothetical protein COW24_04075 [Candidatus Kerfeldbacteria bacterium CG15_BIG_FIL_POST_REV_8_21_14_020_45_12]|uniref:Glycosyltransferase RgtA/B/C/D-like domain-containing protein n=1 Tax=Candidatus Kerfeldbacteria bacterium CG15_BIG_FIL_POST_REV_8_21_14_020_45_12 TaxID=2014247 RepID=A0A2M7H3A9_9BACT|nr:MAG: hypothetical protein COW24_04075 [Candidatus Kerfeldbacteria bacterium CG15_BIG_FIL_POST_REV_8_21_14_020_45_12]PJA93864.1 MAG: hypothetical protein CO132_01220 [Candidatus Kerfeldbacteria bacterium CG_4_9_14_3_um_filter_45_8]